jgi:hypothetical protein
MPHTYLPRQSAPVERILTGTAAAPTAGADQSLDFLVPSIPFAEEGDK